MCLSIRSINKLEHVHVSDQQCVRSCTFLSYKHVTDAHCLKITLINLQNNTDVILRICCDGNTLHVDRILCYVQCKIQKNWCTVTVAPTIEHHCEHSRLFIGCTKGTTWTFNFSTYNNQDLAIWLRRWTRVSLILCRARVRILLWTRVFHYVIFACSSQLDWQRVNEINHDIHSR